MIGLSLRLAVGGGREQWVRLVITAAGVCLGAVLLLLAAVTFPAIRAHEARDAWTRTDARTPGEVGTDPLLWRVRYDGYAGADILRVDVAPLGPRAPLPPGLSRLPGPGELAVSPGLRRLLRDAPPAQLGDRFPGRIVASVGAAALRSPGSLVVFAGYEPEALRGQPGVVEVRGIESRPDSVPLTRFGRVVLGLGSAALLLPIVVLIGTATRLAAARREERLAAMRLVGATPRQVRVVAVVEAVAGAAAGTLAGFAVFAAVRPLAARVDLDGSPFFTADLRLAWWSAALVGLGVPALAGVAATVSLRRVRVSPLGVFRQAAPGRPTWRRLVPLGASLVLFAASMPTLAASQGDGPLWLVAAAMTLLIGGIVAAGPWFTMAVGRLVIRLSRGAPTLIAGRRLAAQPVTGFRAISGLVLAVFLVTMISEAAASALVPQADPGQVLLPANSVGMEFLYRGAQPVPADRATALAARLRAIPGVTGVLDLRWPGGSPPAEDAERLPVVTRCADLRATGMARCADPEALVGLDAWQVSAGVLQGIGPAGATADPDRLPMVGVLATTDGRRSTMESARTAIEVAAGGTPFLPWTADELKGQNHRQEDQLLRIADAGLVVTLLIAGCSLAVSVAGGLVERKRPFALLRLAGMRPGELRRVLFVETVVPLVAVALASAALGVAVAADVVWASHVPWRPPVASFWWVLCGGLALSAGIVTAVTAPLLGRLTSLTNARFE